MFLIQPKIWETKNSSQERNRNAISKLSPTQSQIIILFIYQYCFIFSQIKCAVYKLMIELNSSATIDKSVGMKDNAQ